MNRTKFAKKVFLLALISVVLQPVLSKTHISYNAQRERYETLPKSKSSQDTTMQMLVAPENLMGLRLDELLRIVIDDACENNTVDELPYSVLTCHEQLENGATLLDVQDLAEALPVVIEKLIQVTKFGKAPRPDAPGNTDGAPVGTVLECDFAEVLQLLNRLTQIVVQCCAIIQKDFQGVFTVLNDIKITVSTDFINTWTILADLNDTLTTCCATIQNDFEGTFTVLNDIKVTVSTDFINTWTILADLNDTLTTCCATIQNDFDSTWTILADIKQTITTDFNGTFTAIAAIVAGACDLSGVYTTLNDIKTTITTDFNGTFTAIAAISTGSCDLSGVYTTLTSIESTVTTCCATIQNDFDFTWTILADIKQTITTDFNGTFTALNACCNQTFVDFNGVFTSLTDIKNTLTIDFNGTFTALNACCNQTFVDFNGVFTSLTDIKSTLTIDFNGTFTALNACCNQTFVDFNGVFTSLTDIKSTLTIDFNGTFTVLNAILNQTVCSPVLITQAMVDTTGFTITQPGVYILANNIVFSPLIASSAITINASNVTLNLQCATLTQGNSVPGVNGIAVGPGTNTVLIENGVISNFTANGIEINDTITDVILENVTIRTSGIGAFFNGTVGSPIINFTITESDFVANGTGLTLLSASNGSVSNSVFSNNTSAGISLINSFSNIINMSTINNTAATNGNAFGISAVSGGNNRFEDNIIDATSTSATFSGNTATGLLIGATEQADVIMNNQISNSTTTSNAQPFGIQMQYTFTTLTSGGLPSLSGTTTLQAIAWSPNDKFLAIASLPSNVAVVKFVGNDLVRVASVTTVGTPLAVSWSPDGQYLAVGVNNGTVGTISVYQFNGSSLNFVASAPTLVFTGGMAWSHSGEFIAYSDNQSSFAAVPDPEVVVLEFTGSALNIVASNGNLGASAIDWSPDSEFIAAGPVVLQFSKGTTLTIVASLSIPAVTSVNWALDGRTILFGATTGSGPEVQVASFTGSSLVPITSFSHGGNVNGVKWASDAQYAIIVGAAGTGGFDIRALKYTGASLSSISNVTHGATNNAVSWSRGGRYIAVASNPNGSTVNEETFLAYIFPSNGIIRNNEIFGVAGPTLAAGLPGFSSGRGLSASSNTNLIIQNTAYNNDINYVFVTNTYQQFLANVSSTVPNNLSNLSFPPL